MKDAVAPACASSSTARAAGTGISGWRDANQASKAEGSVSGTAIREGTPMLPRPGARGKPRFAGPVVAARASHANVREVAQDPFFPEALPVPPDADKRLRAL